MSEGQDGTVVRGPWAGTDEDLPDPTSGLLHVTINASPQHPLIVGVGHRAGMESQLLPAAAKICEHLAMAEFGKSPRPPGPLFPMLPNSGDLKIGLTPDHFLLVLWYRNDGHVDIDDRWCRQLGPAQLWAAAKFCETRVAFVLQQTWFEKLAETETGPGPDGMATPAIFIPGRS